ncbi:isochorismate synthase [Alicyclobacillus fastidiosus]|uniref:isochorismate synthase n=1 Tax=Alicyclobacillus fastidiosus TaxID=392011 RepID=A0ABY6ZR49_9BACL|nr:isochorismate synthase [Alicyclobacillus fastidiosus]WAH44591.1 isochorismate synthase [Alicyclobacillus fastidiosus]GMA60257.1 isochorismate synthase [Alicyclobacillus fastidiosus]
MKLWQKMVDDVVQAFEAGRTAVWGTKRIIRTTTPADVPLSGVLHWQLSIPAVFSSDPVSNRVALGLGAAEVLHGTGPDAMGDIQAAIRSLDDPEVAITWFGGFAFDPTQPVAGALQGWPHALWFVPTLTLMREAGSDCVTVTVVVPAQWDAAAVRKTLADICTELQKSPSDIEVKSTASQARPEVGAVHDEGSWRQLVETAVGELQRGDLHKVVLARQTPVDVQVSLGEALARVLDAYGSSHVFAMLWEQRWLIAASPEQLVRVTDGTMAVDCLAGTADRSADAATDEALAGALFSSEKNRIEHAAVVRVVVDRLKLVAEDITVPRAPVIKKLANVQHLYTPIRGRLQPGMHLFDAARLLHPTPAVGGVPLAGALQFIRQHEGWPRGYYAGAIGFVDTAGSGLLSVALRSAAVAYPRATLYAGCGIVAASDPNEEWRETEMKLKPMRLALG